MLLIAVKCKFKQWQLEVTRNRKKNSLKEKTSVVSYFPQEQEPARGPKHEAFNFAIQNVTQ